MHAVSMAMRFKGKEQELLEAIETHGIDKTMAIYKIRYRNHFLRYVESITKKCPLDNPLSAMSGGEKHKFLKDHRETILDCLEQFGKEFVMVHFNIEDETLERLVKSNNQPHTQKPYHHPEPTTEIALEIIKDLGNRVRRLETTVNINSGLTIPISQGEKSESPQDNSLDIKSLLYQGNRLSGKCLWETPIYSEHNEWIKNVYLSAHPLVKSKERRDQQ